MRTTPLVRKFALILSAIVLVTISFRCTKIDLQPLQKNESAFFQRFFQVDSTAPRSVLLVANELKRQHAFTGFIDEFARKEGLPVWGKAIIVKGNAQSFTTTEEDEKIIIPLVQYDTAKVKAALEATIDAITDEVFIKIFRFADYTALPYGPVTDSTYSAEKYVLKLIYLDELVFGQRDYGLLDNELFKDIATATPGGKMREIRNSGSTNVLKCKTFFHCINVWPWCDQFRCDLCPMCQTTICYSEDPSFPNYDPSSGSTSGGTSGTGSGTGNPTGNNCYPGQPVVNGILPCGGGGNGPVIVVSDEPTGLNSVIYDTSFNNTLLKCQLDNLKLRSPFFNELLNTFDGVAGNALTFKIGSVQNGTAGVTKGWGGNRYEIIIPKEIDTSSNLIRILILTHELIHARMFYSLERAGVLHFDSNGDPLLDSIAGLSSTQVNINTLSEADRFRLIIKRYNDTYVANGWPQEQWTHALFSLAYFDNGNTYRQKLAQLLYENGNWEIQPAQYKLFLQNSFVSSDWEYSASTCISWEGLQATDGYGQYLNSFNPPMSVGFFDTTIQVTKYQSLNNCPF